jgi:hypothetical protein
MKLETGQAFLFVLQRRIIDEEKDGGCAIRRLLNGI